MQMQENEKMKKSKKQKKKLTIAQKALKKAEKKRRQEKYMTIFVNGIQKRVLRPETIDGMDADEYIRNNADPIWLHQNGMWEYIDMDEKDEENEEEDQGASFFT